MWVVDVVLKMSRALETSWQTNQMKSLPLTSNGHPSLHLERQVMFPLVQGFLFGEVR